MLNRVKTEKNFKNLKPFKKGISGNPSGRPKSAVCIPDLLREIGSQIDEPTGLTKLEAVLIQVWEMALTGNLKAIEWIADRTEGKVLQPVNLNESRPLEIIRVPKIELNQNSSNKAV